MKKICKVSKNWLIFRLRGAKSLFEELCDWNLRAHDGVVVCNDLIDALKRGGKSAKHEGH